MLYIFDSTEKLIATLPEGSFFDAVHHEVLNGENTFQFTVPAGNENVVEGNLVAFRDLDSYWQVFEIKRLVDQHGDGLTRTAYCEHIFYELLDDIVTDKRPSADATAALAGMLEGTRWQVGTVDDLGASSTNAYYESALSGVQKVANAWRGELNWRCVIAGGIITRYVDLLAMVGTDTGKQFVYSKDILSIEREVDLSGVYTALYGRGKGVELESGSYGRRLTFAGIEGYGKPLGQEWVGDSDALAQWGRPGGRHRFGVFTDEEETDPNVLLQKTWDYLQTVNTPRVTYRLNVVALEELSGYEHEKARKGDLVRVIDREFEPELVVSARVIELERDLLAPENTKVTLGSFAPTIVEATINTSRRVEDMANRPFNTKWLDGNISVLQNAIENVQSYVFQTGEDGILLLDAPTYDQATQAMKLGGGIFAIANQKDGQGGWNWRTFGDGSGFTADLITAGIIDAGLITVGPETTFAPGYDPVDNHVYFQYSANGTTGWHDVFNSATDLYMRQKVGDNGTWTDAARIAAVDGADGKDGVNGTSSYLWVRYSQNADGSSMTTSPANAKYIGIATTTTPSAPTSYTSYSWSLIKGQDGIPGEAGTDGQTSYLHIKYSDDGVNFTANNGEDVGAWIGTYVDFTQADSMVFSDYTWNKVKGDIGPKGETGAQGVAGANGTSIIWKGEFASHPASPQNGWAYRNTSNKKSYVYQSGTWYQMTIDGIDGANGIDGKDGLSIVWKGEAASPPANPQENWAYRDTDNGVVYIYKSGVWTMMVSDGSDGADGAKGADGMSVYITYHDNATTSPPATPTGDGTADGWHTAPTAKANWMSQKVATSVSSGTWGSPIMISGGRRFVSQPIPPYDIGDLWIGGSDGKNTLICINARATGSFVASDWGQVTESSPSVGMGVDSDCLGLWHFDGSLNSHKGVAVDSDGAFDTGCFGQAVKVTTPISGDISTSKESGMSASSMYSSAYSPDNLVDGSIVFGPGTAFASASGATLPQWHQIDLGDVFSINKVRWINNRGSGNLPKNYTISVSETGAFAGEQAVVATVTGNTTYSTWVEHIFNPTKGRYVRMTVSAISSGLYYELTEWQVYGTRLGVLKAPTTGLSTSQGTISLRAKNLSASVNGSVLVDLPKSDNTQGIKAGIANDGRVYIADSPNISKSYTETTQADFNSGTLTDVVATSAGDLELTSVYGSNLTSGVSLYAESSANADFAPSKAVDGNATTRWCTAQKASAVEVWFAIKMSSAMVSRVKLLGHANFPELNWKNFKIQGSNNSTNGSDGTWTDLATGLNTSTTAQWDTFDFNNTASYQWIKIVGLTRSWAIYPDQFYITFAEIEIYEKTYNTPGTREKIVDLSGSNPAGGTKIEWSKTTPAGTAIKVETALSTDGGSTYGAFTEATSGSSIPDITAQTDLSNARLKIKETLSTTDPTVTPKLHSLTFNIWEKQATIAYGPNKSTLTAWDSISLAYKSDRLSLVVNDEEACYIENPGLPPTLGSCLYVGTDRNLANAINTFVDELRIDKVYREPNTRIGWHKAGVPFYTSEDMKQWPGYVKVETDGLKVYDSSDALRVLLGSWLSGAVRKYGLKIIGGELYSSQIYTGEEGADSYAYLGPVTGSIAYPFGMKLNGKELFNIISHNRGPIVQFYDPYLNERVGVISTIDDSAGQGLRIQAVSDVASGGTFWRDIHLDGRQIVITPTGGFNVEAESTILLSSPYQITLAGDTHVSGTLTAIDKHNAEPTESYGIVKLTVRESPEHKYIDEDTGVLVNGECRVDIDPIFLQCIEMNTPETRWGIHVTPYADVKIYVAEIGDSYFVVKECDRGTSTGVEFMWTLSATRKNYKMIRYV